MSLPIYVEAYSGYKANERPRQFTRAEVVYEIDAVLDQWYEPSATYFKVQSTERKTYLLRYDQREDEWTLQTGMAPCRQLQHCQLFFYSWVAGLTIREFASAQIHAFVDESP